ncbi:hypothetical protein ATHL_01715 [Anaerolinea thermolimosa]|nr:hypothetical protein ATHL_01715 [Anaerolinea thermolimosa]
MKITAILFTTLLLFILFACSPLTNTPQQASPTSVNTSTLPPAPTHTPSPEEPIMSPVTNAPVTGEAPQDVLDKVLTDLEQRLGHKPSRIEILRSEFVTWNDGSLGCPKPGVYYTQATVDGYWIIIKADEKTYDYRVASSQSTPVLCSES